MNIASLIAAAAKVAKLTGAQEPAFKQLMDQIKVLLGPADKKKLDEALAVAAPRSDEAHGDLQDAAAGRP